MCVRLKVFGSGLCLRAEISILKSWASSQSVFRLHSTKLLLTIPIQNPSEVFYEAKESLLVCFVDVSASTWGNRGFLLYNLYRK
jgi:hypothetical protein